MGQLDDIDHRILTRLQEDCRNTTPGEMAEDLPVSDQTVRNRITSMERDGVILRYVPVIDYAKAGYPIRVQFSCSAPVADRHDLAGAALDIPQLIRVDELMSATNNVCLIAVTHDTEEINRITLNLDDLGLEIEDERLLRQSRLKPVNQLHPNGSAE